jgi:ribosome-binding protein aMBF1 (putative translation factor)
VSGRAACGEPMRRYEKPGRPAVPDWLTCGRRRGHPGRHISALSLARRPSRQEPSGSPAVAAVIRQAREAAGLSQRRLAAVVGVTEVCVQLWEGAKRTPGDRSWVQLEFALGPLGIVRAADPRPGAAEEASDAA